MTPTALAAEFMRSALAAHDSDSDGADTPPHIASAPRPLHHSQLGGPATDDTKCCCQKEIYKCSEKAQCGLGYGRVFKHTVRSSAKYTYELGFALVGSLALGGGFVASGFFGGGVYMMWDWEWA